MDGSDGNGDWEGESWGTVNELKREGWLSERAEDGLFIVNIMKQ